MTDTTATPAAPDKPAAATPTEPATGQDATPTPTATPAAELAAAMTSALGGDRIVVRYLR